MAIFNRKKNGDAEGEGAKKEKGSWRRPASACRPSV